MNKKGDIFTPTLRNIIIMITVVLLILFLLGRIQREIFPEIFAGLRP